jgi:hypothetical protein
VEYLVLLSGKLYLQSLDGKAYQGKTLAYSNIFKLQPEKFNKNVTRAQCYKTFYVRALRIFVLSYSVCPWEAFPALSNVCG